ncbi:MAG: hypothetical protein PHP03_01475 [Candidatus Pacebacteria bacterium]|nr:hypothetical protein [Candidatus Paceibacterota bacterium]
MKVKDIILRQIFDSRAEETLEVDLITDENVSFWAQIPSGKSRGSKEAAVFDLSEAQKSLKVIGNALHGKKINSVREMDDFLVGLDGTANKSKLGGNLTLGISVAFARVLAFEKGVELNEILKWEFFGEAKGEAEKERKIPMIFSNLINGGSHAKNNLDIQEYMIVVKGGGSLRERIKKLVHFYRQLGGVLEMKNKKGKLPIGDEGGYAVDFKNNIEPLEIMEKLIYRFALEKDFALGIDAAASNFQRGKEYRFEGKLINTKKLEKTYKDYLKKIEILYSLEDPFAENDFEGFNELKMDSRHGKIVVGDDLTVTNPDFINKYAEEGLISAVIIKPNQIGTVTETCEAMIAAKKSGLKTIVSHRSGETDDNFIIHLAKAGAADGVKIGAPIHERIYKFNELMRIYND